MIIPLSLILPKPSDPGRTTELGEISAASPKDVDIAIAAAQKAYDTAWGLKVPGTERGKLLLKLADLVEKHADELAALEALNNGKPWKIARSMDVQSTANVFRCVLSQIFQFSRGCSDDIYRRRTSLNRTSRYYGGMADKIHGKTIEVNESKLAYTRIEPSVLFCLPDPRN